MSELVLFNTLSREKEPLRPLRPPHVGLYVCGPTVYGDAHLGHARPAITFDILFRYLTHLGYKVRYVRNITDVGHLENDADEGEDKIGKKARLEELEPMEVVQQYTESYHRNMRQLNVKSPSIEPRASAHIMEQQDMIRRIMDAGYAYESGGSVYFDVVKYNKKYHYGRLSGRKLEELSSQSRELEGQSEKHSPFDFALWKKASPGHIMNWKSEWSEGYPGWHLECSAMSTRYLGEEFDIHGGGLDLLFPHHECEIAQSTIANGKPSVRHWMHNNLITINGQKMGKSLGNFITLDELFSGKHEILEQAYSPMTIRFFMLQAHYRSTLDFSNEALQASEKGLERLSAAMETLGKLKPAGPSTLDYAGFEKSCYDAMNDDLNTPVLIARLFEGVRWINQVKEGRESLDDSSLTNFRELMGRFINDILGLQFEDKAGGADNLTPRLIDMALELRQQAKMNKDFATSDKIRDSLAEMGIKIKDTREGAEWEIG